MTYTQLSRKQEICNEDFIVHSILGLIVLCTDFTSKGSIFKLSHIYMYHDDSLTANYTHTYLNEGKHMRINDFTWILNTTL